MMGSRPHRSGWAASATVALVVAASADAQALRGAGEVQYQNVDRPGVSPDETWVKSLRLDYARRLPGLLELSSHLFLTEQTRVGRSDRVRTPQGTLQLAHPYFGMLASYRPAEVRNASGFTSPTGLCRSTSPSMSSTG